MSAILLVNESQGRKQCVRNWYKYMTRPKYIAFHKDLSSQEHVGLCFTSLENKWPNFFFYLYLMKNVLINPCPINIYQTGFKTYF